MASRSALSLAFSALTSSHSFSSLPLAFSYRVGFFCSEADSDLSSEGCVVKELFASSDFSSVAETSLEASCLVSAFSAVAGVCSVSPLAFSVVVVSALGFSSSLGVGLKSRPSSAACAIARISVSVRLFDSAISTLSYTHSAGSQSAGEVNRLLVHRTHCRSLQWPSLVFGLQAILRSPHNLYNL